MKTLYDKLKPDILASIKADFKIYPYTSAALVKELKTCINWSQLSIAAARSIVIHSHVKLIDSVELEDLWWGDEFLIKE